MTWLLVWAIGTGALWRWAWRRRRPWRALARVGHLADPEPRRLALVETEQQQCERTRRNDPDAPCTCGVVSWARPVTPAPRLTWGDLERVAGRR